MKTDAAKTHEIMTRAIDELVAALAAGQSQQLKDYLTLMARFHRYSWGNVLLINSQFPGATRVAGYRTWQSVGRQVRQGARGIRILAPILIRAERQPEEERVVAFRGTTVFDISQTEGSPLVEFAKVTGQPGLQLARLKQLALERGIDVVYTAALGAADGASAGGRILLRQGLDAAEEFSVLTHELAHEALHRDAKNRPVSISVRETEAEAVAFMVCQAAGLETGTSASDYIQLYQGSKEMLLHSLARIQRTASAIIRAVCAESEPDAEAIEPLPQAVKRPAA